MGDLCHPLLVLRKQIERQGFGHAGEKIVDFIKGVKAENGQKGPEDLLLHNRVAPGYIVHHRGRDLQRFSVCVAAQHRFFPVDQAADPFKVLFIDDPAVIRV